MAKYRCTVMTGKKNFLHHDTIVSKLELAADFILAFCLGLGVEEGAYQQVKQVRKVKDVAEWQEGTERSAFWRVERIQ